MSATPTTNADWLGPEWEAIADGEPVLDGEIVPETETTLVPYTGEVLALGDMTDEQLAAALDDVREWERDQLAHFKRELQEEVLRRMDQAAAAGHDGAWTIHTEGGYTLTGDSPERTEYPLDEVKRVLATLKDEGLVDDQAIEKIVVPNGWKVAKRALQTQLRRGGRVRELLAEIERPITRPRTVRVERKVGR